VLCKGTNDLKLEEIEDSHTRWRGCFVVVYYESVVTGGEGRVQVSGMVRKEWENFNRCVLV
jgi:hypothetical protein